MPKFDEIYQKINGNLVQIVDKNLGNDSYIRLDQSNWGGSAPPKDKSVVPITLKGSWSLSYTPISGIDTFNPSSASIDAERGSTATWTGTYSYSQETNQYRPSSFTSNVSGWTKDTFPADKGIDSVSGSKSFTTNGNITISASETFPYEIIGGYTLENGYVKYVEGEKTTYTKTAPVNPTISVTFKDRKYWGESTMSYENITESEIKNLGYTGSKKLYSTSIGMTVNFTDTIEKTRYFHYCYPKSWGTISDILLNGVESVFGGFKGPKIVNMTNSSGQNVDMYLYSSLNPGAYQAGQYIVIK